MNGIDLGIFPPDTQGPLPTTQRNVMEFATNKQNDYYPVLCKIWEGDAID